MDLTTFKAIIEYYGEENLIGIGFDNSASLTFQTDEQFLLANNLVESIQCLQFINFDRKGVPFTTVKHIETIQSLMFKSSSIDRSQYDFISVRC